MPEFSLMESPVKGKKYRVVIYTKPKRGIDSGNELVEIKVDFGADGYEDYTMHQDLKRKKAYIARHQKNEDWTDYKTAGFWSRWLLWNKPTLLESYLDVKNKLSY